MISLLFYNIIMILCMFICFLSQKKHTKNRVVFAYLILIFISVIRFDIGNDYEGYWHIFYDSSRAYYSGVCVQDLLLMYHVPEPFTLLLVMVFCPFTSAPIWIFGVYSSLTIYFIYRTIEYWSPRNHALCIFILFISCVFFETWDWVRQGLALSILLYSLKYINQGKRSYFFLCMTCAFCCHFSAAVFFIVYFIRNVRLNDRVILVIIGVSYLMGFMGFFGKLYGLIFSMLPLYSEVYAEGIYTDDSESSYQTLGFFCLALWYGFFTFQVYRRNILFGNLLFIGSVLTMIAGNNLLITRIAWYFTSVQILAVPLVLKKDHVGKLSRIIMMLMVLMMFIKFNKILTNKTGVRGSSPYETIFSSDYENKNFRLREYTIPDKF